MLQPYVKFQPEIKTKLLKALRSGEYAQNKGALRDGNRYYCCLGVLCEIVHQERPDLGYWVGQEVFCTSSSESDGYLPEDSNLREYVFSEVSDTTKWRTVPVNVQWLTVEQRRRYGWDRNSATLAGLNDAGFSFGEIADLIEKYL